MAEEETQSQVQQEPQAEQSTDAAQAPAEATPTQVEGQGSREEHSGKGGGNQLNALFRLLKKQDERMERLEERFSSPPAPAQAASTGTQAATDDIWADPESYIAKRARQEAQGILAQYEKSQLRLQANEYVYSQDDVKTEEDVEEIKRVVKANSLDILAEINPAKAAELAIKIWRDERGVKSNSNGRTSAKIQAGAVQGSMVPSGKKTWTRAEIDKLAGTPEWSKNKDDIMAAYNEGRIKD